MHTTRDSDVDIDNTLRGILRDVLGMREEQVAGLTASSGLFGHVPELDSMAVVSLLTEIEDQLGIVLEDDEIDGELLETFGSLTSFLSAKRAGG
jgi:acyl carrier protein